jgi:hypothetical protein
MEGRGDPKQTSGTMTANTTDDQNTDVVDQGRSNRYAELNIGDEEFVIYDRENHQAWLQSSVAVSPADRR